MSEEDATTKRDYAAQTIFLKACVARGISPSVRPGTRIVPSGTPVIWWEQECWQGKWSLTHSKPMESWQAADSCRCYIEDELEKKYDCLDVQRTKAPGGTGEGVVHIMAYNVGDGPEDAMIDVEADNLYAALIAAYDAMKGETGCPK